MGTGLWFYRTWINRHILCVTFTETERRGRRNHDRPEPPDGGGAGDDHDGAEEGCWPEEGWGGKSQVEVCLSVTRDDMKSYFLLAAPVLLHGSTLYMRWDILGSLLTWCHVAELMSFYWFNKNSPSPSVTCFVRRGLCGDCQNNICLPIIQ